MEEIQPIAMPGIHQRFLEYFKSEALPTSSKVLDVGAGHGAFTQKLYQMGYPVAACDLFPEAFQFEPVTCKKVDVTQTFPYEDGQFKIVIAMEVAEHILDHEVFFGEINRILESGGVFYVSTPNILSLKSRLRFLLRGFFYSFEPLEMKNYNGLQHVVSRTLDQYNYIAIKHGFGPATIEIDKSQSTSKWLYPLLYPWIRMNAMIKGLSNIHNTYKLLTGRVLFLKFTKL